MDEELLDVLPESNRKPYDMYDVIRRIVDDGEWLDLKPQWAKTIITCLARFGGRPVGIVANQPRQLGGILDNDSADKAARFVNLCNAFGLPLVFLQDVPGFMVGTKVEEAGIIRHGAKMLHAVANATVPKVTVVLRKAYGAGYYVMNGRAYEPDLIVAWPSAEISVMGAEGAVEIVMRRQVEEADDPAAKKAELIDAYRQIIDVYVAARNGMIDDVIDPRETRPVICRALEMAEGKIVERPWKRNASCPSDQRCSFDLRGFSHSGAPAREAPAGVVGLRSAALWRSSSSWKIGRTWLSLPACPRGGGGLGASAAAHRAPLLVRVSMTSDEAPRVTASRLPRCPPRPSCSTATPATTTRRHPARRGRPDAVDLRAVTTVGGNAELEKVTLNARRVLTLAGVTDVPVAAGAAGPRRGDLITALDVHGQSGLDGAELPEPADGARPARGGRADGRPRPGDRGRHRAADQRRRAARALAARRCRRSSGWAARPRAATRAPTPSSTRSSTPRRRRSSSRAASR